MSRLFDKALALGGRGPWTRSRHFARFLAPSSRPDLVHIGTSYGGWTIPAGLLSPESVCYCAGVGLDISFDLGLIERFGCSVEAFDPTAGSATYVARKAAGEPRFRFHPLGIWSEDGEFEIYGSDPGEENFSAVNLQNATNSVTAPCRTIGSLMQELGHEHLDLLKLDIEGAEFEVIRSICDDQLSIGVLCIEFHRNGGVKGMKAAAATLRAEGFVPVNIDGYDTTFVHDKRGRKVQGPPGTRATGGPS